MDNASYGVISGIEKRHLGGTYGCMLEKDEAPYHIDFAAIARVFGAEGVAIDKPDQLADAVKAALASRKPTVIQVPVQLVPTPTSGHWEVNRMYKSVDPAEEPLPALD
jgi:acetolactate synthase-1/2/3 large subunit